jgi:hypothetical protein
MITAIDFGCYAIRSAFREEKIGAPVTMYSEKSEYIVLPNIERYRRLLDEHQVARAECEDTLAESDAVCQYVQRRGGTCR